MGLPIQNLRSGTADKRPNPAGLADGVIAINYNEGDPAIYIKGHSGALIKVAPTFVGSTQPNATPASGGATGNAKGETWLDTTNAAAPVFKIYDGSNWVEAGGSGGGATGGGSDQIVIEFDKTVTTSYTIGNNKNALGVGPLGINNGATVTVPSGSNFLVL